jgi:hypothetical protein
MEISNLNFELTESIHIHNAYARVNGDGEVISVYDFNVIVAREHDGPCDGEEFISELESGNYGRKLRRLLCGRCESWCRDRIDDQFASYADRW